MRRLPQILEINDTDLVWVPRINIVNGITDFHLNLWKWRVTEQGWINFQIIEEYLEMKTI